MTMIQDIEALHLGLLFGFGLPFPILEENYRN